MLFLIIFKIYASKHIQIKVPNQTFLLDSTLQYETQLKEASQFLFDSS